MEERRRSGEPAGYAVKNKGPSGCLILKKKATDSVGPSASRKVFESKKKRKRPSDELLMQPRTRLATQTSRNSNALGDFDMDREDDSGIVRKRDKGEVSRRGEMDGTDRGRDNFIERTKLNVFDFDEYEANGGDMRTIRPSGNGAIDSGRLLRSMTVGRSSHERDYDSGSSRDAFHEKTKGSYFERASGLARSAREGVRHPIPAMRDNFDSDKPIWVQGKNGVLKVMVNKKKKVDEPFNANNSTLEPEKIWKDRTEESAKKNVPLHPSYYSGSKKVEKAIPFVGREKTPTNLLNSARSAAAAAAAAAADTDASDRDSDDSDTLLTKKAKMNAKHIEPRDFQKTPLCSKISKSAEMNSDDSDTSLKQCPSSAATPKSTKRISGGAENSTPKQLPTSKSNEGKAKRGSGTEKQKLREKIRGMLIDAGWTIDYRPRRNRDYLDAVYINATGTAYWSIVKAYDALLKQQKEDEEDARAKVASSQFKPLSDDLLSQLTRNTRKKMEKEMRKKQRDSRKNENARETLGRKASSSRYDEESMDSDSHEEKLSSFVKQGGKSFKGNGYRDSSASVTSKGQKSMNHLPENNENLSSRYNSHHGRKSRKLGRCTLLVRKSNPDLNSDGDGFVPYTGKRTLLSWLVDCGAVQLSQKVRYMNRRRTKVLLEGWVTRDGIHCGCCSKILTVSKFEIHAGSKLRQPFQNIYLDSGVSLLDCQIDAWNRQEAAENIGFHSVDVRGDDPNDDTCLLCGDGGDLICCDGCPSTFHQSCLDIEMLPPGDWHCPNCTCKFCKSATDSVVDEDDPTVSALPACRLCARKYHESCMKNLDAATVEGDSSKSSFCSGKCSELHERLLKYTGVKHELEAGFSWSIIRRADFDLDTSLQGLPQRVEGNSKLALALSVMDECFLPIMDRRSGMNLLHGVLYNCGSNFNRLNYSGFFTVILERGDEIISAASLRLHGTELAEMPFIGTRHIYRRQGMCKRLFGAVELALRAFKVERLIIPAISELMRTWTEVFGFTKLDESLKQELKSMNTVVFPGVDMLQKQLLEQGTVEKRNTSEGEKEKESLGDKFVAAAKHSDSDSSAGHDHHERDNGGLEQCNEVKIGPASTKSDSLLPDASVNGVSTNSSLDASQELKQTVSTDSGFVDKLDKSGTYKVNLADSHTNSSEPGINAIAAQNCCGEDDISSHAAVDNQFLEVPSDNVSGMSGSIDASHGHKLPVDCKPVKLADSDVAAPVYESASVANDLVMPVMNLEGNSNSCKDGCTDHAQALNLSESASEGYKGSLSTEQTKSGCFRKEDKVADVTSEIKCPPSYMMSNHSDEMEVYPPLDDNTELYKEVDLAGACTTDIDMAGMEGEAMAVENFVGKMHPISPELTKVENSAASFLHKPEHVSETDASEGETESE